MLKISIYSPIYEESFQQLFWFNLSCNLWRLNWTNYFQGMPEIINIKISIIFLSFAHCQLCLIISHVGPHFLPYFTILCITLFDIQTSSRKEKWHKVPYVYYTPIFVSHYESYKMNIEEKLDRALQQLLREFTQSPSLEVFEACPDVIPCNLL